MRAETSAPDADQDSVCAIAPEAQYRGTENQLYRVEIHSLGILFHVKNSNASNPPLSTAAAPTFKWSRDNGSVAFVITDLQGSDGPWTATLQDLGKDDRHTLNIGDWVEIFEAGVLRRADEPADLLKVTSIDPIDQTVGLERPLVDPNDGVPQVIAYDSDAIKSKRPLLRRWDQDQGEFVIDPKPKGGELRLGTIPINPDQQRRAKDDFSDWLDDPVDPKTWFTLEDGIRVQFQRPSFKQESIGIFFPGDYWLIPARTASNGTILWPRDPVTDLPLPRDRTGVSHHYAALAVVVNPTTVPQPPKSADAVRDRRVIINQANMVILPTK
jgi:hypothetical protein